MGNDTGIAAILPRRRGGARIAVAQPWLVALAVQCAWGANAHAAQADWQVAVAAKAAANAAANAVSMTRRRAPERRPTKPATIVTFDAPGAAGSTTPVSVNSAGSVTGPFYGGASGTQGFIRTQQGGFTEFSAPGAVYGTYPISIDAAGDVVGYYYDENYVGNAFIRAADGTFSSVAGPHGLQVAPTGVSPNGGLAGSYYDIDGLRHAFRFTRNGRFTGFEAPGAGIMPYQGTQAIGINRGGTIVGTYTDFANGNHEFIRSSHGTFTDVTGLPGNLVTYAYYIQAFFVQPLAINTGGAVTGAYFQPLQNPFGGNIWVYVRAADGSMTTFPAEDNDCCTWSWPTGINAAGTIAGYIDDGNGILHGFVRATDGTVTQIDAPGAGTGVNQGTAAAAISGDGKITGYYQDSNNAVHGFLWLP